MRDWIDFILKDFLAIFSDFSSKDLQYPFAFVLWIILISLKLHGVDHRDHIAGLSYTLYCTTVSIVLFLALPQAYTSIDDIGVHVAFVSFIIGVTSYKWFHRNDSLVVVSKSETNKNKKQDLDHEKA